MTLNEAIKMMTSEIIAILADSKPTVYLYGSVVLDDFQLGWSDIDILVLTGREITEQQANVLVGLRQALSERYLANPYFRLFEGGMLSADAFLQGKSGRTVYWGTSGQRITDGYKMDSFGSAELLDSGILLFGGDIRPRMTYPTYEQMRDDVARHLQAARTHGVSVGWLLDIARGIYTVRTGKIIAKTTAGEWAAKEGLCPDSDAMQQAVKIRREPQRYTKEEKTVGNAAIQRFADILEGELAQTARYPAQAESELRRMGIPFRSLSLIRQKDGVVVWRVTTGTESYVMKYFDKPEYRREIAIYDIMQLSGIPTLKFIAHTDRSLLMEDIERSDYRLGTAEDIRNPKIAKLVAGWYKTLHENGREYANTHPLYDECDCLTMENIQLIQEKIGTGELPVWRTVEDQFTRIQSITVNLPRTLTYNDFHYTNLVVARDGTAAMMFDYNMLGKGYVYSDIRNVCGHLGSEEARTAFLSTYGCFDEKEVAVDNVVSVLTSLYIACQREHFPGWGNVLLAMVRDGRLQAAVEKLLKLTSILPFEDFLKFRNVSIRTKDHERIVRMFYPHLTSVCGVPESLSKVIGEILGVDFSDTAITTGCFNGMPEGGSAPHGTPDLYCRWKNGIQLYVYGALPQGNLASLKENEYVLFALSDGITDDIERTEGRYVYMRRTAQ